MDVCTLRQQKKQPFVNILNRRKIYYNILTYFLDCIDIYQMSTNANIVSNRYSLSDRFGNRQMPSTNRNTQPFGPYYASGTPVGNNFTNNSTLGTSSDSTIPFNGSLGPAAPQTTQPSSNTINTNAANNTNLPDYRPLAMLLGQIPPLNPGMNPQQRRSSFMMQTNCPGMNYNSGRVDNVTACQHQCIDDPECNMWSYNNLTGQCFMKDKIVPCSDNYNYTSGTIINISPILPGDIRISQPHS